MRPLLILLCLLPAMAYPQTHGLTAEYYKGMNFEQRLLTRTEASVNLVRTENQGWLGRKRPQAPPPDGVPEQYFSVRWTGDLLAPESGTYTFSVSADDGMRIWVGDVKILDAWKIERETQYTAEVYLEAGQYYPLRVEYFNQILDAVATLSWRRPSQPESEPPALIPASQFYKPVDQERSTAFKPKPSARGRLADTVAKPAPPQPAPTKPELPKQPAQKPVATPPKTAPQAPVALPKLTRGKTLTLPNLYFELNTPDLEEASEPTLDALVAALAKDTTIHIQIAGHTDIAKDKAASQKLSLARAETIKAYLADNGIASTRISTIGYGCNRPLNPNPDPRNRRVEVVVR